ncbi:MAG: hypothetical protein J6O55_00595 [Lachnospiraceae bacterium]|nr:hypothetical protein [Lachnospiraceae bacterium]
MGNVAALFWCRHFGRCIKRYVFNIEYSKGRTISNQMVIALNIMVLKEISYLQQEDVNPLKNTELPMIEEDHESTGDAPPFRKE